MSSSSSSSEFGPYPSLIMHRKIEHIYDLYIWLMGQEKDMIILNQISTKLFTLQRSYIVSRNTSSEFGPYPSLIMYRKIYRAYIYIYIYI